MTLCCVFHFRASLHFHCLTRYKSAKTKFSPSTLWKGQRYDIVAITNTNSINQQRQLSHTTKRQHTISHNIHLRCMNMYEFPKLYERPSCTGETQVAGFLIFFFQHHYKMLHFTDIFCPHHFINRGTNLAIPPCCFHYQYLPKADLPSTIVLLIPSHPSLCVPALVCLCQRLLRPDPFWALVYRPLQCGEYPPSLPLKLSHSFPFLHSLSLSVPPPSLWTTLTVYLSLNQSHFTLSSYHCSLWVLQSCFHVCLRVFLHVFQWLLCVLICHTANALRLPQTLRNSS